MNSLSAANHLDTLGSITQSAANFADALIHALKTKTTIEADMSGLYGIPTTYFNVLLLELRNAGKTERVIFKFRNKVQQNVYQLSCDAIKCEH
jgi:hypothetical protein